MLTLVDAEYVYVLVKSTDEILLSCRLNQHQLLRSGSGRLEHGKPLAACSLTIWQLRKWSFLLTMLFCWAYQGIVTCPYFRLRKQVRLIVVPYNFLPFQFSWIECSCSAIFGAVPLVTLRRSTASPGYKAWSTQKNHMGMLVEPIWARVCNWFKGQDCQDMVCWRWIFCQAARNIAPVPWQCHSIVLDRPGPCS
jgi:hypothetical protein